MDSNKKNKYLVLTDKNFFMILGVCIIVLASIYGALFYIIESKIKHTSSLIQELESAVQREKEFRILNRIIVNTEEEREKLDTYFINPDKIVSLIERVESFGERANVAVSFDSIHIRGEAKKRLNLSLKTEGDFDDTFYFLTLFESLPLKMSFEKVFITKGKQGGLQTSKDPNVWTGDFDVVIISFVNDK